MKDKILRAILAPETKGYHFKPAQQKIKVVEKLIKRNKFGCAPGDIIAVLDNALHGSGKLGYLISATHLYVADKEHSFSLPLSELTGTKYPARYDKYDIILISRDGAEHYVRELYPEYIGHVLENVLQVLSSPAPAKSDKARRAEELRAELKAIRDELARLNEDESKSEKPGTAVSSTEYIAPPVKTPPAPTPEPVSAPLPKAEPIPPLGDIEKYRGEGYPIFVIGDSDICVARFMAMADMLYNSAARYHEIYNRLLLDRCAVLPCGGGEDYLVAFSSEYVFNDSYDDPDLIFSFAAKRRFLLVYDGMNTQDPSRIVDFADINHSLLTVVANCSSADSDSVCGLLEEICGDAGSRLEKASLAEIFHPCDFDAMARGEQTTEQLIRALADCGLPLMRNRVKYLTSISLQRKIVPLRSLSQLSESLASGRKCLGGTSVYSNDLTSLARFGAIVDGIYNGCDRYEDILSALQQEHIAILPLPLWNGDENLLLLDYPYFGMLRAALPGLGDLPNLFVHKDLAPELPTDGGIWPSQRCRGFYGDVSPAASLYFLY